MSMKTRVLAAGVVASFVSIAGADVIYSDGSFTPANWGFETLVLGAGGTSGHSQVNTGNPGQAREITNNVNGGGTVWGVSRFGTTNATRYEPATMGAIISIDFTIDSRFVSGAGGDGHGLVLAAKQGTVVYGAAYSITGSSGNWSTFSITGLTAADFAPLVGSGPAINFSNTGAPIRFGFAAGNSAPGGSYSNVVTYDNWGVTVHNVPASGSLGLLGVGGLAAIRRRRA